MVTDLCDADCLVALAKGGRAAERATEQLYDAYMPRFMAFLRVRGINRETAEELVQDVFIKLFNKRADLAAVESPRAYLWCMLRNAMIDHRRALLREREVFAHVPDDPDTADGGFSEWLSRVVGSDGLEAEREDLVRCIGRALERLRQQAPEKALAIELTALEGLDGRQLSEALGRTYGAARQFLSEARKALETLARASCGALLP